MAFLLQRSMHVAPSVGVRRMVVPSATAAGAGADKPKVVGKAQIVEKLSERLSITKTAAGDALDALVEVITESVGVQASACVIMQAQPQFPRHRAHVHASVVVACMHVASALRCPARLCMHAPA